MSSLSLNNRTMTPDNIQRPSSVPVDLISRMHGKEVSVILKDGKEIDGILSSIDENTNIEIKIGGETRFIQGEFISTLSFR